MKKHHLWLAAAIIWCIIIFFASASPTATGGSTQMLLTKWFGLSQNIAAQINVIVRKSVHLGAFGLLAVLFYHGFKKRFWFAWIITTCYAITDEIHQLFLPGRTGSAIDVLIDSIGAIFALGVIKLFEAKRKIR